MVAGLLPVLSVSVAFAQSGLADKAANRYPKSTTAEPAFDFYGRGPYRATVPKPDDLLGYPLGTWHSTFRDQERVLLAIADAAKDRVRVFEYGKSVEGRPLRVFAISTPENIATLDTIREKNLKLTDPRTLTASDADSIVKTNPALVWTNECIHGSETASFETAMATLYNLAASDSPEVTETLKNTVVFLNPVFNPDGHERFVVYYNAAASGNADSFAFEKSIPWLMQGRFNHNRFDMNRDKVVQSQPEMRQETAAFLHWYPQVFVDQHGQPENYFFPPNAKAVNPNVDRDRIEKWTDIFGKANGTAFDQRGWSYVNRETFDLFYPGYLDSFTTLCGAIGQTYETDGGGDLVRRRTDGTLSTLRDATAHHFESAIATIEAAAKNRETLLHDFLAYKRSALSTKDPVKRIILSPARDAGRAAELATLLLRFGIEVKETTAPITVNAAWAYEAGPDAKAGRRTFPAGSLVVDLAQPQGHLARAILEQNTEMESDFVKAQLAHRAANDGLNPNEPTEEYGFYDTTAWSIPLTFGLEAFAVTDIPAPIKTQPLVLDAKGEKTKLSAAPSGGITGNITSAVAYAIAYDSDNAAALSLRLLQEDYRLSVASKPVMISGKEYRAGTILLRAARNPATLQERLDTLGKSLGVPITALPSAYGGGPDAPGLGSEGVSPLKEPRIAVVAGDGISQTSFGSVTFTLDQMGVTYTTLTLKRLKDADVRAHFNVLVFPDGSGYKDGLGKEGITALKEWSNSGGCLVGLAGGAAWMTDKDSELSSVRVVGEDDSGEGDAKKSKDAKNDHPVGLPGAIFRARIRTDHFLGYGYPDGTLPIPLAGETFWKLSETGTNVVTFAEKGPSRLSGFVWPNNTEKLLAGTAYVVDEPVGSGHLLLFLQDPTDRYMYPGLRRLFLSALLFGAGRESSQER